MYRYVNPAKDVTMIAPFNTKVIMTFLGPYIIYVDKIRYLAGYENRIHYVHVYTRSNAELCILGNLLYGVHISEELEYCV